jgi:hypothetical protein
MWRRWWLRSSSLLLAAALAQGQGWLRLPSGKTRNEVDPFDKNVVQSEKHFLEVGSEQVGGIVNGRLIMRGWPGGKTVGVLRCPQGTAMVGLRTRVGTVVDYMQVYCSRPYWTGRFWTWNSAQPGPSTGNPQGGDHDHVQNCGSAYMVSGFWAFTTGGGAYLRDVRIECARIRSGAVIPMDVGGGPMAYGVLPKESNSRDPRDNNFSRQTSQRQHRYPNRRWAERQDSYGRLVPFQLTGYDERQPEHFCDESGATGIAFGLGRWMPDARMVVQAMTMYCVGSYYAGEAPKRGLF